LDIGHGVARRQSDESGRGSRRWRLARGGNAELRIDRRVTRIIGELGGFSGIEKGLASNLRIANLS